MLAAALPLFHVLRWRWVVASTALLGFLEAVALLLVSAGDTGLTVSLLATVVVALLLIATSFLLELSPPRRDAIGWLGGLAVPASFTLSTGAAFLFAGDRHSTATRSPAWRCSWSRLCGPGSPRCRT